MTVKEDIHVLVESLNEAEAVEALHLLQLVVTANGDKVEVRDASAKPAKPASIDKPLWGIAGIGSSAEPTNVAKLKDEYLAEAFESERS
ncbi:MAG: hypothetical protein ACRDJH_21980 [Thermomicrobiales bacterium]